MSEAEPELESEPGIGKGEVLAESEAVKALDKCTEESVGQCTDESAERSTVETPEETRDVLAAVPATNTSADTAANTSAETSAETSANTSTKTTTNDGPSVDLQEIIDAFDPLSLKISKANSQATKPADANGMNEREATVKEDNTNEKPCMGRRKSSVSTILSTQSSVRPKRIKDSDVKPFDFQRFLDQLRHKSADPIARYVKSFLTEFCKRPWTTREQVKIISDFRVFITGKMELYAPFSKLEGQEFVNAQEGMEKLIMNRLYTRTFSPEVPADMRSDHHEEDNIRDKVVAEKMRIWGWIEGRHLDLGDVFVRNGEAFVKLASDELCKVNHYRAPRDKMICVLNCCKVIFGLLRQSRSEESADDFLPILIYVVIKAQPQHLISNVNYIQRFRNQDMLSGEAAYYLSSLVGVISFIETLDRSALSITDEEFERNVEHSVKSMVTPASVLKSHVAESPPHTPRMSSPETGPKETPTTNEPSTNASTNASTNVSTNERNTDEPTTNELTTDEHTTNGLAMQPMNASNVLYNSAGLIAAPFKTLTQFFQADAEPEPEPQEQSQIRQGVISPEESAARQVSAEELEAQRISAREFESTSKTLQQMFPDLDQEVIQDVLRQTESRVGAAVDVCLALVEEH